ncbi:high mobility group box domain-containing protein, partial [Suillus americanus]
DGLPRKRKRERKVKDPNAPKGPASAYILFQNDIRSAYKKEHPDMSNKELLRLIGDQWKTLSDDKKDFYRDQHGRAKKKHEVDLAAYNAQNPDHVPAGAKDSDKKKQKKKEEESEHPATKEVAKAAPKTTKKAAASVCSFVPVMIFADVTDQKVVPKSKEVVESSGSEAEDASEVEASDAESSDDEPAPKAKAKATTDEDSESDSEVDTSSEEEAPPPPPPKKSRK